MARKVNILSMLIAIISLGLLCTSLVTFKWYVDTIKEIGIFGICHYRNNTTINRSLPQMESSNRIIIENTNSSMRRIIKENITQIENINVKSLNETETESFGKEIVEYLKSTKAFEFFSGTTENKQCFNLLLPNTDEAFDYLTRMLINLFIRLI